MTSPLVGGCIDGFKGSNVQIDFVAQFPAQASSYGTALAGQFEPNSHFTLYGVDGLPDGSGSALFSLQEFEIHPVVDLDSPCYIDVGEHVPFPGLHVSQFVAQMRMKTGINDIANPPAGASEQDKIDMATALQREQNVIALGGPTGLKVVSSSSSGSYPKVAADCNGSDAEIPPKTCTLADANARRLKLCQAAWAADPNYFEGSDRVLTKPLNGQTYGFVDGTNPINFSPVGGAQWFIDEGVKEMDAFAIYHDVDGMPAPGALVFYGEPTMVARGVEHVHLTDPSDPSLSANVAVFANVGEDDVHF